MKQPNIYILPLEIKDHIFTVNYFLKAKNINHYLLSLQIIVFKKYKIGLIPLSSTNPNNIIIGEFSIKNKKHPVTTLRNLRKKLHLELINSLLNTGIPEANTICSICKKNMRLTLINSTLKFKCWDNCK